MLLHVLNEPFKSPLDKRILAGSHMFLDSQVLTFWSRKIFLEII